MTPIFAKKEDPPVRQCHSDKNDIAYWVGLFFMSSRIRALMYPCIFGMDARYWMMSASVLLFSFIATRVVLFLSQRFFASESGIANTPKLCYNANR